MLLNILLACIVLVLLFSGNIGLGLIALASGALLSFELGRHRPRA